MCRVPFLITYCWQVAYSSHGVNCLQFSQVKILIELDWSLFLNSQPRNHHTLFNWIQESIENCLIALSTKISRISFCPIQIWNILIVNLSQRNINSFTLALCYLAAKTNHKLLAYSNSTSRYIAPDPWCYSIGWALKLAPTEPKVEPSHDLHPFNFQIYTTL